MQPFHDARSAPNDLTEADMWALGQAVVRARQQCELLMESETWKSPSVNEAVPSKDYEENLLTLGRLCTFGQDLEPAKTALTKYLNLSGIEDAKSAHLLLARVYAGLGDMTAAESQMDSLVDLFPYDGDTHLAIDQTIDAAEPNDNSGVVARLNELQLPYTLKALSAGGILQGRENQIDAATLAKDALRCAGAMRRAGKTKEAEALVEQIKTLTVAPSIAQTASKPAIDNALLRYAMVGQSMQHLYGAELRGELLLKTGRTVPTTKLLTGKTTVLIAFSLGAPASEDVLTKFMAGLQKPRADKPIQAIAITSYAATSGEDRSDEGILKALKAFVGKMTVDMPVLLVSDSAIKAFSMDAYPAAVVIDSEGKIAFLDLIPGTSGSIYRLLQAAQPSLDGTKSTGYN